MKRVIKDFKKLPEDVKSAIRVKYAEGGLIRDIITISNTKGIVISVLPFNTEEVAYLVRLPDEDIEEFEVDDDYTAEDIFDED